MSDRLRRRKFLVESSRAALSIPLLPFVRGPQQRRESRAAEREMTMRWEALIKDLERQLPKWMQEANVPGLSIAIIKDGKLGWRRGFGVKDNASKELVDNKAMFEAASMSKPVFAYIVLKLCEKGVMNLDTPLTRYSPERFLEGDPRLDLITARHVLSHTSGFPNWRSEKEPLKIHFTPGEKFLYSGEGYSYLQSVVTHLTGHVNLKDCAQYDDGLKVCGTDIEAYIKANLFAPFQMNSSGYVWNNALARRMTRPHDQNGKPTQNKKSTPASVTRYGSAGALLTTPTDYAKFVIEVIDPKPGDAFRLNRDSVKEMLRPHVKIEGGQYPASWALGWQIFHNNNRDYLYHGGDNDGFHCCAVASVEGKSGFVVMTNGENGPRILTNLIMGNLMQKFLSR
jgi:CubicO group peptidase (beta-lactamase class C family)